MPNPSVVYLFGAGATQAAVSAIDEGCKVLIQDITQDVFLTIRKENLQDLLPLSNALLPEGIDIEHLISHLLATFNPLRARQADQLRGLFRASLLRRLRRFSSATVPTLFTALFNFHTLPRQPETLKGIISLNYDQLADIAFNQVFGGINYALRIDAQHSQIHSSEKAPPFIKLHGSFNWQDRTPIALVDEESVAADDAVWIPPGLAKTRDHYPFDILWGRAHELLDCEILRVVGCSLNPSDMHLVSMLFRTQALSGQPQRYRIQLIDYPDACARITSTYGYLAMEGIIDQPEFLASIASELFPQDPAELPLSEDQVSEIVRFLDSRNVNIFDRWLHAKIEALVLADPSTRPTTGPLASYMGWEER